MLTSRPGCRWAKIDKEGDAFSLVAFLPSSQPPRNRGTSEATRPSDADEATHRR
jgi:hypothetical protein